MKVTIIFKQSLSICNLNLAKIILSRATFDLFSFNIFAFKHFLQTDIGLKITIDSNFQSQYNIHLFKNTFEKNS